MGHASNGCCHSSASSGIRHLFHRELCTLAHQLLAFHQQLLGDGGDHFTVQHPANAIDRHLPERQCPGHEWVGPHLLDTIDERCSSTRHLSGEGAVLCTFKTKPAKLCLGVGDALHLAVEHGPQLVITDLIPYWNAVFRVPGFAVVG